MSGSSDASLPTSLVEGAPLFIVQLDRPVEWMRFCFTCESEQRFVADRDCPYGLVGCCTHCGDQRIAPFTRANSEVE